MRVEPGMGGPDRYELVIEGPVKRSTATINIRWEDKAVFDSVQTWLAYQKGRPVHQWDVFTFLLAAALETDELAAAEIFVPS